MKDSSCIFCKIANGEIPSETIYEDDYFRAILDLGPASKGHTLILPKEHYGDICDADTAILSKAFPLAARIGMAAKSALGATGFNVVQNNGTSAGQTVFHLHIHVIPRYEGDSAMVTWTPGQDSGKEMKTTAKKIKGAL